MILEVSVIVIVIVIVLIFLHFRRQRNLRMRAYILCEAIKNKDYSFRLSRKGLFFGERAMQEAFEEMGQEIRRQQAEKEVESWQRLTRVLTHEIMNATAPIASISQSFLKREDVIGTPLEDGIRAICDTSRGLNDFVQNYRKLTQLQSPTPSDVNLLSLINSVATSYPDISWEIIIPEKSIVHTDESLLRQVIINLTKNAIEAGAKAIGVKLSFDNPAHKKQVSSADSAKLYNVASVKLYNADTTKAVLLFSNDGTPIPAEIRSDIFTPFFSTKRTGTGIGLSLSRQIMVMQGGELSLQDFPETVYHTTFAIKF